MFLGVPHQASRYYGTLLKSIESTIFLPGHPPIAYYASALALYRFESFLRKMVIDAKYRPFKYHLLAIARMQIGGIIMPPMSSNKFEKYCEAIVQVLKDDKNCFSAFENATKVLDTALDNSFVRDRAKDVSLLSICEQLCKK